LGQTDEASREYRAALAIHTRLTSAHPDLPAYQQSLGQAHNNLGVLLKESGKLDEAVKEYEKARRVRTALVKNSPTVPEYQQELATTQYNLGNSLRRLKRYDEAHEAFQEARKLQVKLLATHPDVPKYLSDLSATHNNWGILRAQTGDHDGALREFHEAWRLRSRLAGTYPEVPSYRAALAGTHGNLFTLHNLTGNPRDALNAVNQAVRLYQQLHAEQPRTPGPQAELYQARWHRADVLEGLKRHREAAADWAEVLRLERNPAYRPHWRRKLALALARAGDYRRSAAEADELARSGQMPKGGEYDLACADALNAGGVARDEAVPLAVREKRSEQYARRAVALLRRAADAGEFKSRDAAQRLAKDEDLAALRERDDFRAFVASLSGADDQ
jgi:tetratricopeptide (TPR) repeat protein